MYLYTLFTQVQVRIESHFFFYLPNHYGLYIHIHTYIHTYQRFGWSVLSVSGATHSYAKTDMQCSKKSWLSIISLIQTYNCIVRSTLSTYYRYFCIYLWMTVNRNWKNLFEVIFKSNKPCIGISWCTRSYLWYSNQCSITYRIQVAWKDISCWIFQYSIIPYKLLQRHEASSLFYNQMKWKLPISDFMQYVRIYLNAKSPLISPTHSQLKIVWINKSATDTVMAW